MGGLFTGIIGSIIGSGIQSTFGRIPISEDASRALDVLRVGGLPVPPANWFSRKTSDEQTAEHSKNQEFGQIGQQIAGAMQVMGPCMQVIRALEGAAFPQPQSAPAKVSKYEYDYRPRQSTLTSKSAINPISESCDLRGSSSCSSIQRTAVEKSIKTEKAVSRSQASHHDFNAENMGNCCGCPKANLNREADGKIFSKGNGRRYKTTPQDREVNLDKLAISGGISKKSKGCQATVKKEFQIPEGKKNLIKPKKNSGKSVDTKECALCHAQMKVQSKLSLKPCGHVYCINCLFSRGITGCPKCKSRL